MCQRKVQEKVKHVHDNSASDVDQIAHKTEANNKYSANNTREFLRKIGKIDGVINPEISTTETNFQHVVLTCM